MALLAAFLVMLLVAPSAFAVQYPIDWTLGANYQSWTNKAINVGDTLVFTYDNTHTVDVVSKSDYENCDASKPIESHKTSPTTITLKEGTTYIICGTAGHCPAGMKLQVTAKGSGSTPSTPAPTGSGTPSGSGSGSSTPSSPSGNGADASSRAGVLMLGAPLVLGSLFAFIG